MAAGLELTPASSGLAYTFVDEEELLGFKIWVAELELLVGNARGRTKPDPVQCFQLLQKLAVTLDRSSRPEVKEYQRRCEEAVVDILLKGAPPPVRRLICTVLAKLYLMGDQLPLYSRVSSLQLFLGTKEAFSKEMVEDVRLGALECMAALYYAQGRSLSIGVQETVAVASKYCAARHLGERTLQATLRLLAAAVEGVGGGHRQAQAAQGDVFRAVERLLASTRDSASDGTKIACANVLRALGACGGAFLWASSLAGFEAVKALCLAGLGDPAPAVRAAFAAALGTIAAASESDAAHDSARALEKRPKYKAAQEKALADVPTACLTTPFVEAASYSNRPQCTALAQAWVTYLSARRASMDEQAFVDVALRVLEMLGASCLASGSYQEAGIVPGEGELGMGTGSGERPHAQACVLYVLRVGVIEQLGEGGQRLLLDRLATVLAAPLGQYTPVGVVALEAMALLLEVLGEVSADKRGELEPSVGAKVAGPHACLRVQAAATVAALAVAEPSCAARLVGASLANLDAALRKLVEATASAPPDRSRPSVPGTPRGVGSVKLKPDMNAVHGWALSGAALVAASRRLPLGVPAALLAAALEYATRLIMQPQSQPQGVVCCLEREAGYILLGALCATLPAELLGRRPEALLALFEPALGQEAATELDRRYCSNVSSLDHVVAMELWWRTAALQALEACIQGPLAAAPRAEQAALYKRAAALLKPTLDVLTAHAALQEPARGKGGPAGMFAGAAALLQLRLLEAYAALASPSAYAGEQEALTKLCMRTVRAAATGSSGQILHSALRRWLQPGDALLGPWQMGRDPLERALYCFEGVAGGPALAPWQAGSRAGIGYAMEEEEGGAAAVGGGSGESGSTAVPGTGSGGQAAPYPQPKALGAALLEAQLSLVGRIFAAVAPVNQAAILDALTGIAQGGPQRRKDKDPQKQQAAAMAACAAALACTSALAAGGRGALAAAGAELAPRVRQLAEEVLEDAPGSVVLQRGTADLYAAAAQLGGDAAAPALVRGLCKDMAETASLSRRAALALAVGSCARAMGGLSLQAVLPLATETLVAVAAASDRSISVWIMHAMLLLANAAGLAFVPHLKHLLGLAESMLLSEEAYSLPGLLPAVGRLANATVALLGPDYTFGSRPYLACKSIINDMRALEGAEGGGALCTDDAVAAALETVLYSQMLVLFAPQAVPAKSHLPVLVSNLLSRQPLLRKAAADTLRHLAERDARSVLAERVEAPLFAALDGETDPGVASQIKATLSTLLEAGAASEPSRWVTLCSEVVMAVGPGSTAAAEEAAAAASEQQDSDDEEGAVARPAPAAAPAPAAPSAGPAGAAPGGAATAAAAKAPRLRTRLFAAQLLLRIPALVCGSGDARHADLAAAQAAVKAGQGDDWLVVRLQQLVDLAFRMASGQLEALRPRGVQLMAALLDAFGESADPVVEGARLMELYQAQVVSTLRAALAVGAAPSLSAAGASLAAAFLERGLDGGDAAVLQRLMTLLVAPLGRWGMAQEPVYAEWVDVRARVALLEAHAHCAVLAAAAPPGSTTARVVRQAQNPHMSLLLDSWAGLLLDYVAVCTQPAEVQASYRLRLCQLAPAAVAASAPATAGEEAAVAEADSAANGTGAAAAAEGGADAGTAPAPAAPAGGPTPVAVLDAVRPALQHAWQSVLDATTGVLAEQPAAADDAAAREQHGLLLDLCMMAAGRAADTAAASSASGAEEAQSQGQAAVGLLATALVALRRLTAQQFLAAGWLVPPLAQEVGAQLLQLLQQVLLPAAASGRSTTPAQAVSLAEGVAAVLRQLPADGSQQQQQQCLAAGRACLQLAAGGGGSTAATADVLAAVSKQLQAAGTAGPFAACLEPALQLGVEVACSADHQQQLTAAAAFLADAAAAAGAWQQQQAASSNGASGLQAVEGAVGAALQALAQHARQCSSSNGASSSVSGQQLEAAVGGMLALGATLSQAQPGPTGAAPPVAAAVPATAAAPAAVAPAPAAAGVAGEEEDWGDDPFGDSTSAAEAEAGQPAAAAAGQPAEPASAAAGDPAAAPAAEAGAAGGGGVDEDDPFAEAVAAAGAASEAAAEWEGAAGSAGAPAAGAGEPSAAAVAGQGEEDEWGDDPFGDSMPPAGEAAAGAAGQPTAADSGRAVAAAATQLAALSLPPGGNAGMGGSAAAAAGRQLVLDVLADAAGSRSAAVQLHSLTALAAFLQQQQAKAGTAAHHQLEQWQPAWALQCAAAALPGALARVHELMGGSSRLGEGDIQAVAAALKAGLLSVNLAAALPGAGESGQAALLRVLMPTLIQVAAPEAPPTPLLADMAVKLLTHLAASPAAAAFRAVAAELPASTKQRLQGALQAATAAAAVAQPPAAGAAPLAGGSSGPMQRSSVKINFAAFKK